MPSLYVNINININYLRFGNFIGEAVESDEEGSQYDDAGASAYVDIDEEDGEPEDGNNQQLMELDGMRCLLCFALGTDERTEDEGPSNAVILHEGKYIQLLSAPRQSC